MPKKPMKFKGGGKIKRYAGPTDGSYVEGKDIYQEARDRDDSADMYNERTKSSMLRALASNSKAKDLPPYSPVEDTNASVRRALAGERPPAPEYTEMPSSKVKDNKFVKAVEKVQKSQGTNQGKSVSSAPYSTDPSIPNAVPFDPNYKAPAPEKPSAFRKNFPGMASIYDYYQNPISGDDVKRNLSNAAMALTPLTGGASKVASEFLLGNRAAKAATGAEKLSPAGQRLKNMEEVRNVAMPGRKEAVTNPMAWAGGPRAMEKIAQVEGRAAQAETKAAAAAARKKAAQAKKDAKDPVMSARPGADKAKAQSKYKYETDEAMPSSFGYKKGGAIKKFAKGGSVSSASSRADGIAIRGKTKGTMSKMCGGGMYKGKK
jgi:hypothetical protein